MNHLATFVHGIPLDAMQTMFAYAGFPAEVDGNCLAFEGPRGRVEIRVEPQQEASTDGNALEAVLVVRTEFCPGTAPLTPGHQMYFNRLAGLGAYIVQGGKAFIESRLATREEANPWGQYAGLLYHAALLAASSLHPAPPVEAFDHDPWPGEDLIEVTRAFASQCVCSGDEQGFTAEFSLRPGTGCAGTGDERTALLQIRALDVHPRLGFGLRVLLNLPHQFLDEERLARVIGFLNAWEGEAADRPPHFGAWCLGNVRNPCYTMFLPTSLRSEKFVLNVAGWMRSRALLANGFLLAHGIQDDASWKKEAP